MREIRSRSLHVPYANRADEDVVLVGFDDVAVGGCGDVAAEEASVVGDGWRVGFDVLGAVGMVCSGVSFATDDEKHVDLWDEDRILHDRLAVDEPCEPVGRPEETYRMPADVDAGYVDRGVGVVTEFILCGRRSRAASDALHQQDFIPSGRLCVDSLGRDG